MRRLTLGERRQCRLDQRLGIRARDQRSGGNPEIQAPEFAVADDEGQRFARDPAVQQDVVAGGPGYTQERQAV